MHAITRRHVMAVLGAVLGVISATVVAVPQTTAVATTPGGAGGGVVRIMPLGDSITDGYTPYPGGYRVRLWQRLVASGRTVDFVGSRNNGPAALGDHDHEGHPGWRIDQLDANIAGWLRTSDPRTILLHIGTNDINQDYDLARAPARLSRLIDHILAAEPGVQLFVARIITERDEPRASRVAAYNAAIPGVVRSKGPQVHLVDMNAALTAADLADGVHPSQEGYDKMAPVWYDALRSVPASLRPLAVSPADSAALRRSAS